MASQSVQPAIEQTALSLAVIFSLVGFAAPAPLIVTGYVFALVGGFVGLAALPIEDVQARVALEIGKTVITALFVATIFGVAQPHLVELGTAFDATGFIRKAFTLAGSPALLPWVMGLSGLISRWLAQKISRGDFSLPRLGRQGGQP